MKVLKTIALLFATTIIFSCSKKEECNLDDWNGTYVYQSKTENCILFPTVPSLDIIRKGDNIKVGNVSYVVENCQATTTGSISFIEYTSTIIKEGDVLNIKYEILLNNGDSSVCYQEYKKN